MALCVRVWGDPPWARWSVDLPWGLSMPLNLRQCQRCLKSDRKLCCKVTTGVPRGRRWQCTPQLIAVLPAVSRSRLQFALLCATLFVHRQAKPTGRAGAEKAERGPLMGNQALAARTFLWRLNAREGNYWLEARPETRGCENISAKRPTLNTEQAQNRAGAPHGGKSLRWDGLDDPPPWAEGVIGRTSRWWQEHVTDQAPARIRTDRPASKRGLSIMKGIQLALVRGKVSLRATLHRCNSQSSPPPYRHRE